MMYSRYQEQEESIYNLIPTIPEKPPKAERHKSKFLSTVKNEQKTSKADSKTMGPAKVPLNETDKYLKKRSKLPQLPDKTKFHYQDEEKRRPAVPNHVEKPVMGIKSNKNFISSNAIENIMSVPKKPSANFADTKNGATHPLDPSGLTPKYIKKKDFGKTPVYLAKRKEEVERAQEEYDHYIQESMKRGAMKCLSNNERQNVIAGLKSNWEEIHHQYQGLSVVTDTAPKKNRKERMEAEMNQLEKDIELLEKHPQIYIASNSISCY